MSHLYLTQILEVLVKIECLEVIEIPKIQRFLVKYVYFNQLNIYVYILLSINNICNVENLKLLCFCSVQGLFLHHKGQGEYQCLLLKPIYLNKKNDKLEYLFIY